MPRRDWSALNKLQVGRYAEYFVKMEFASYGFQVFTSEVDDRGIDLVIRDDEGHFYEVQVKSVRGPGSAYVFATKTTAEGRPAFDPGNSALYMALVLLEDGLDPAFFLIPAAAWKTPGGLFADRDYGEPGQSSRPEYGLNISRRNQGQLDEYRFENVVDRLQGTGHRI